MFVNGVGLHGTSEMRAFSDALRRALDNAPEEEPGKGHKKESRKKLEDDVDPVFLQSRGNAVSPGGAEYAISSIYKLDPRATQRETAEVHIWELDDTSHNWTYPLGARIESLGSDNSTIQSSLDEIVDLCKGRIESGKSPDSLGI